MSDVDIAVIDQGSIYTKIAGGCLKQGISYLTRYAPVSRAHRMSEIGYLDAIQIDSDPTWYVFGENLTSHGDLDRIINNTGSGRYYSEEYRRGIAYALFRLFADREPGKDVNEPLVILSVPAEQFAKYKDKIEKNILGNYKVKALGPDGKLRTYKFRITIDTLNILPEGAGTMLDFIQAEEQGLIDTSFRKKGVAVASWGWYTLSLIIFDKGKHVSQITLSNSRVGMQSVSKAMFSRLGIDDVEASLDEIDQMVRSGIVNYMGREIPATEVKVDEISSAAKMGLDWLQSQISSSRLNISTLMFTGGTAEMFWPHLDLENYTLRDRLPADIFKVDNAAREDCDGAERFFRYKVSENEEQKTR